jgi:hypothetical protein
VRLRSQPHPDPIFLVRLFGETIPLGGIIGSVHMHGTVDKAGSKWFTGPVTFKFSDPRILPFQPLKGALGFFPV